MTNIDIEDRAVIGQNIRAFRERAGLSVDEILEQTGAKIARGYWYEVERAEVNVTIDTLSTIAAALDVTVRDLLKPRKTT